MTGRFCETVYAQDCSSDPCFNEGNCTYDPDYDEAWCDCMPGTTGTFCEIIIPTSCTPDPCENGGTCEVEDYGNGPQAYCYCPDGVTGRFCEIILPTSCSPDPCENGGSCEDSTSYCVHASGLGRILGYEFLNLNSLNKFEGRQKPCHAKMQLGHTSFPSLSRAREGFSISVCMAFHPATVTRVLLQSALRRRSSASKSWRRTSSSSFLSRQYSPPDPLLQNDLFRWSIKLLPSFESLVRNQACLERKHYKYIKNN